MYGQTNIKFTISKLHNMLIGKLRYILVIETTLGAGRSGFRISVREINFSSFQNVQTDCGANIHPPIPWVPGFLPR